MFRALFEELGESGGASLQALSALAQPQAPVYVPPPALSALPQAQAPVYVPQPTALSALAPAKGFAPFGQPAPPAPPPPLPIKPLEPARPRLPRNAPAWNPNPADTIGAALFSTATAAPQPARTPQPRKRIVPSQLATTPTRQLPYIPTIEAFIFYRPADGSDPFLWTRTVINHNRNLRDILTLTDPLMGGRGSIEILFFGLIQAEGADPTRTFTFAADSGLSFSINGRPVEPQRPTPLRIDGTQVLSILWDQHANNNYRMELIASPHPIPTTWLTATKEANAPYLVYAVFDRERKGPRGGMLPRAALFEEFRHPDRFGLTTTNARIVQRTFPILPTRTRFLALSGAGSGASSGASSSAGSNAGSGASSSRTAISPTAWNTITILFYADEFPRATPQDCVHHFFTQEPFVFGLEYCVAGHASPVAPEGVYLRGEWSGGSSSGQTPVYASTPLEKATWYIFVAAYRGSDLSFGAYPIRASTQEERLAITIRRGLIRDVTSIFHTMKYGGQMHIGYGFRGLIARIHYFDKYAAFEDALEQEFTDSFVSDWYR